VALDETLRHLPPATPIRLNNVRCPYCGTDVSTNRTAEHVIGRRFVPKGMLNGEWNLILWACEVCNGRTSDLEDDISAITMQRDVFGRHADDEDEVLAPALIAYVESFDPKASGENFNPHVTTGVAPRPYLDAMLQEPFETFTFSPADAAVFQLGQYGTAARELRVLKRPASG
jgi:hypothetical protein